MVKFREDDEHYGVIREYLREVMNQSGDIATGTATAQTVTPTHPHPDVALQQDDSERMTDFHDSTSERLFQSVRS